MRSRVARDENVNRPIATESEKVRIFRLGVYVSVECSGIVLTIWKQLICFRFTIDWLVFMFSRMNREQYSFEIHNDFLTVFSFSNVLLRYISSAEYIYEMHFFATIFNEQKYIAIISRMKTIFILYKVKPFLCNIQFGNSKIFHGRTNKL